ncbi:GlxA family transcriptional regulator [Dysgonomonas sp. 520]|uniref:GlxA family transcriptional regulator n=1 Tax=Dysgonomonas sp. 520 TaxID=2302931 RepID=UPI0013D449C6|nr:GlxA family transcriptional regulator [Dysgonomonas sp. 520]NDW09781.1 GlxA family transcriptional regulator [Dysgonomonas sp. 520]
MATEIRHIAFLVISDATLLDITGPLEVFYQANDCVESLNRKGSFYYKIHTISVIKNKRIKTASGVVFDCDENIQDIDYEIDTLFIPGVPNRMQSDYRLGKKILNWIREQSLKVERICSVCTGTFFLAEAGILEGRNATTHWELCDRLAQDYPLIKVKKDPIFVKDGNIYTSAGISSGMDLALALVEEDSGRSLAMDVARQMVLYLKRPGNQSQYSSVLIHQNTDYKPIQDIENWIVDNLQGNLTVENLAEKASMSPRNFARVFLRETGITPAKYVDKMRVESACRYLVDTQLSFKEIAVLCGLGSVDNMRKVFMKYLQITPVDYRKNFRTAFS